ncbi:MAG TPA: CHAT domain-containing protein [Bacteroidales bacterium]|nr:CHAT domain-containing protein [Bacteroidales bacterium]
MKKRLLTACIFIFFCLGGFSQTWEAADYLRNKYLNEGRPDSAIYYADEAIAMLRGSSGEKNILYASMLHKMAVTYYLTGSYKKAKYFILQEVSLREVLKKTNNPDYLNCLAAAALICRKSGDYEEALVQISKAEKRAAQILDSDSPGYADIMMAYAGVSHDFGCALNDMVYLKQEERYLKKAEAIYRKHGSDLTSDLIINITNLAALNNNIGNSPQAELYFLEAIELCKKEFGADSPDYASALNNLGVLYYNTAIYKQAERLFVEAVSIYKKQSARYTANTAVCLNNLGALFYEMGNYKVAEEHIRQAQALMEKSLLSENPDYSVILNNIASITISEEYYASPENKKQELILSAGNTLIKADSIFRLNCKKPHPYYQSIYNNLAIWYNLSGNRKKSGQMVDEMAYESNMSMRVVALMKKMGFSQKLPAEEENFNGHEPVIIPVNVNLLDEIIASNMQMKSQADGDAFTNALLRMILGKATNIRKAVGPYHPAYSEVLKSLIVSYASFDDVKTEEELTLEYMNVINHKTLQDFSFLSESEKEMYYQTRLPDMNSFTSYSLTRKRTNPLITRHTYNNILLNKGLMLKSSTAMRLAILNSNNPELLKSYDDWISLQKEISDLYSTPVELRTKDVTALENKAKDLERSLVERSQDFSDYRKGMQITWEDVKKNLNADEAAIEFTDFRKKERDGGDAVIYCALILRNNSDYPEMVKLCEESQLKELINPAGVNNASEINSLYGTRTENEERLYKLLWEPIEKYLAGASKVYLSPSGLLYKISFPAISNGKDAYLCDAYQIQVKGSTGNLASQTLFSKETAPDALVFGGIKYSESNSGTEVWSYLSGTRDEGDAVNGILEKSQIKVSYLTEDKATETFFKQNAGNYNILHLATHGFFFDDPNKVRFDEKKEDIEYGDIAFRGSSRAYGVVSFVNNENPLMRSGLVLAGANDVWVNTEQGKTDDGVLTAQEVTQIDMRKNDLVVLSACETGLGDIKGTEGVYGLQRALKMAGVKYIIMSLWEIPDRETVEFMDHFYNNLLGTKDIRTAFYKAQTQMRLKYDPYFWGAFVLMQ